MTIDIGHLNIYGKQVDTLQLDPSSKANVEARFGEIESGKALLATLKGRTFLEYNSEYYIPTDEAYLAATEIIANANPELSNSYVFADKSVKNGNSFSLKENCINYVRNILELEHILKSPDNLQAFALVLGINIQDFDLTLAENVDKLSKQIQDAVKLSQSDTQKMFELAIAILAAKIHLRTGKPEFQSIKDSVGLIFKQIAAGKARLIINAKNVSSMPDRLKAVLKVNNSSKQPIIYAQKETRIIDGSRIEVFVVTRKLDPDSVAIDYDIMTVLRNLFPGVKEAKLIEHISEINNGLIDDNFDKNIGIGQLNQKVLEKWLQDIGLLRNVAILDQDSFKHYQQQGSLAKYKVIVATNEDKQNLHDKEFEPLQNIIVNKELFSRGAYDPKAKTAYLVSFNNESFSETKELAVERLKTFLRKLGIGGWDGMYGKLSSTDYYIARRMQGVLDPLLQEESRAIQTAIHLDHRTYKEVSSQTIEHLPASQKPNEMRNEAVDASFMGWLGLKKIDVAAGIKFFQTNGYSVKIRFDNTPQKNIQEIIVYSYKKDKDDILQKVMTVNLKNHKLEINPTLKKDLSPSELNDLLAGLHYLIAMLPLQYNVSTLNASALEALINRSFELQLFSRLDAIYDKTNVQDRNELTEIDIKSKEIAHQINEVMETNKLSTLQKEAFLQLLSIVITEKPDIASYDTSTRYRSVYYADTILRALLRFNDFTPQEKDLFLNCIRTKIDQYDYLIQRLADYIGPAHFNHVSEAFLGALFQLNASLEGNLKEDKTIIRAMVNSFNALPKNYYHLECGINAAQGFKEIKLNQEFADQLKRVFQNSMRQLGQIVDDISLLQAIKKSPLGAILIEKGLSDSDLVHIALKITKMETTLGSLLFGGKKASVDDLPLINNFLRALYALNSHDILPQIESLLKSPIEHKTLTEENYFRVQISAAFLDKNEALISPTAYINDQLEIINDDARGKVIINNTFFPEELAKKAPGVLLVAYSAQQSQGVVTMKKSNIGTVTPQTIDIKRLWEIYEMHAVTDNPNATPKLMSMIMLGLDVEMTDKLRTIRDAILEAEKPSSLGTLFFNRLLLSAANGQATLVPAEKEYLNNLINNPRFAKNKDFLLKLYAEIQERSESLSSTDSNILFEFNLALEKGYFGHSAAVSVFLKPLDVTEKSIMGQLDKTFAKKPLNDLKDYVTRLAKVLGKPLSAILGREALLTTAAQYLQELNHRVLNDEDENAYFPKGILNKLAIFTASKVITEETLPKKRDTLDDLYYTVTSKVFNVAGLFHSVLSVVTQSQGPMGLGQDIDVLARVKAQIEPEKANLLFARMHEHILLQIFYSSVDINGNLVKNPNGKYQLTENLVALFKSLGIDLENITETNSPYIKALVSLYQAAQQGNLADIVAKLQVLEDAINSTIKAKNGTVFCQVSNLISQWIGKKGEDSQEILTTIHNTLKNRGKEAGELLRYFQSESVSKSFLEKLSARLANEGFFWRQLIEGGTESVTPHPVFEDSLAPLTDIGNFIQKRLKDKSFEGYAGLTPGLRDKPEDIDLKSKLSVLFYTMSKEEDISGDNLTQRIFSNWLNQTIGKDEKAHMGRYLKYFNRTIFNKGGAIDYSIPTLFDPFKDDDFVTMHDLELFRDNVRHFYQDMGIANLLNNLSREAIQEAFEEGNRIPAGKDFIKNSPYLKALYGNNSDELKENEFLSTIYFIELLEDFCIGGEQSLNMVSDYENEDYQLLLADLSQISKLISKNESSELIKTTMEKALARFTKAVIDGNIVLNPNGYLKTNPFSKEIALFTPENVFDKYIAISKDNGGKIELSKSAYFNDNGNSFAPIGAMARFVSQKIDLDINLNNLIDDLFSFNFGRQKHALGASITVGDPDNPQDQSIPSEFLDAIGSSAYGLYQYFLKSPAEAVANPDNWTKKLDFYKDASIKRSLLGLINGYTGIYFSMGNIVDIAAFRTMVDQGTQPASLDTLIKAPMMTLAASYAFVRIPLVAYLQAFKYLRNGDIPEFIGALIGAHHVASYTFRSWDRAILGLNKIPFTNIDISTPRIGKFTQKIDPIRIIYDGADRLTDLKGINIWSPKGALKIFGKGLKTPLDIIRYADNLFAMVADRMVGAANWFTKIPRFAVARSPEFSFSDINGKRVFNIEGDQFELAKETINKLRTRWGKNGLRLLRVTRDFEKPIVEAAKYCFKKAGLTQAEITDLLGTEENDNSGRVRQLKNPPEKNNLSFKQRAWHRMRGTKGRWLSQFSPLTHNFSEGNSFTVNHRGKISKTQTTNNPEPTQAKNNLIELPNSSKTNTPSSEGKVIEVPRSDTPKTEAARVEYIESGEGKIKVVDRRRFAEENAVETPVKTEPQKVESKRDQRAKKHLAAAQVEIEATRNALKQNTANRIKHLRALLKEGKISQEIFESRRNRIVEPYKEQLKKLSAAEKYLKTDKAFRAAGSPAWSVKQFMKKHWIMAGILLGIDLAKNYDNLLSINTAKDIGVAAGTYTSFILAEKGIAKVFRLSPASAGAKGLIQGTLAGGTVAGVLTAIEERQGLLSDNPTWVKASSIEIGSAFGMGSISAAIGVKAAAGGGVCGPAAGICAPVFGLAAGGLSYLGLSLLKDTIVGDYVRREKAKGQIESAVAKLGISIEVTADKDEKEYFDHQVLQTKEGKISHGQLMSSWLEKYVSENGKNLGNLHNTRIVLNSWKDLKPETLEQIFQAARDFKNENEKSNKKLQTTLTVESTSQKTYLDPKGIVAGTTYNVNLSIVGQEIIEKFEIKPAGYFKGERLERSEKTIIIVGDPIRKNNTITLTEVLDAEEMNKALIIDNHSSEIFIPQVMAYNLDIKTGTLLKPEFKNLRESIKERLIYLGYEIDDTDQSLCSAIAQYVKEEGIKLSDSQLPGTTTMLIGKNGTGLTLTQSLGAEFARHLIEDTEGNRAIAKIEAFIKTFAKS